MPPGSRLDCAWIARKPFLSYPVVPWAATPNTVGRIIRTDVSLTADLPPRPCHRSSLLVKHRNGVCRLTSGGAIGPLSLLQTSTGWKPVSRFLKQRDTGFQPVLRCQRIRRRGDGAEAGAAGTTRVPVTAAPQHRLEARVTFPQREVQTASPPPNMCRSEFPMNLDTGRGNDGTMEQWRRPSRDYPWYSPA